MLPAPMPQILYTVRATCKDAQQRGRYLSWLSPNHIMEVMKGGAIGARIVLPLPDDRSGQTPAGQQAGTVPASSTAPAICETQYTFPSRKAFDDYLRLHAPALRADGLKHFPPESGVTYERQIAEIAAEL
jgi:hypothetical protein